MDRWMTIVVVFGVAILATVGQGWASWLEHRRRTQTLDVIRTALQAGREPAPELYAQLAERDGASKSPWVEFVVFTALALGFWIAYATADGNQRTAFLVIAATMTVTAVGCLGLGLMRRRETRGHDSR
ncbi:MAG TPA: hypothetical protein VEA80_11370 [Vitreimonas sp.]|uniref:hypothetical protein n=1 Tax=Vitreimonas sp. TaxID=3069702 RepID=UPI002D69FBF0|nr:hypothetical protein [Vitreimonas sp.]HYD88067.1 hypothetical protein [Vitreimonas sp.]